MMATRKPTKAAPKKAARVVREKAGPEITDTLDGGPGTRCEFRSLPTTSLVEMKDAQDVASLCIGPSDGLRSAVGGKFVKIAPTLPVSERASFQADLLRTRLREAGALGVVIAPTFVPDGPRAKAREAGVSANPRDHVKNWIDQQVEDPAMRSEVFDLVSGWMEKEKL